MKRLVVMQKMTFAVGIAIGAIGGIAETQPALADSVTLPDYSREAKKVRLRKCDADTTQILMYRSATYYVTEAMTKSGDLFITFYSSRGEAHFLMIAAGSSSSTKLSREQWYEQIEKAGPNFFRHVRGLPGSDCYVAEEYFEGDP